jgi:D-alanyl-D-alanine carboxypeptidase (penicillin-binding protein 5/6)
LGIGVAPLPSAAITPTAPLDYTSDPATLAVPEFGVTAVQADGFGLLTGTDMDKPVSIASIGKVVTALVVLDARPISEGANGESITFDVQDVQAFNDSVANAESRADVVEGMTLSQRDVINVMLVKSANNYARTLVRWAFGSEEAYVDAANTWAQNNGLANTTIADASGLDAATQSSLADLIVLGELALANPVTAVAVASTTITVDPIGELENSNKLLGTLGVNGIKTGTTDEAGACLLFAANLPVGDQTVQIIGVTVGAPDQITLTSALESLLASIQSGFHVVTPITQGAELAMATTAWGSSGGLAATESVTRVVWSNTQVVVTVPATTNAVGGEQSVATTVTVQIGEEVVSLDVVRMSPMEDPGLPWRVAHVAELF